MKTGTTYRTDNTTGNRAYLTHLRRIFAEREKEIRERVRHEHKPHLEFLEKRGLSLENLRETSARKIAAGTLASLMVMTPVSGVSSDYSSSAPSPGESSHIASVASSEDMGIKLSEKLREVVPSGYQNLSPDQEKKVSEIVAEVLQVKAEPELSGRRLNRTFGLIGAEQHLYRYPGDNIFEHAKNSTEFAMFGRSGIAPGLGAYGYWAKSPQALTEEMVRQEKWYVVAQTFLAPGFKENPNATAKFFKYRKFLVINPDNGKAVVGDLADAGPAEFTGKSFGGSPEVMHELGYGGGPRKGRVIFYFLDDPENKIPLGPIKSQLGGTR